MTEQNQPTEYIELPEEPVLTEQDQKDLEKLLAEETYHPVLKVWTELLKEENLDANSEISMNWANNIVAQYQGVGFADMPAHRDRYFELVRELREILEVEVSYRENCLTDATSIAEDTELNGASYLNLLIQWQRFFLRTELEWDCTSPTAATDISALSEVHKLFFGATGLTGHLEAIKFEFTEDDQQLLVDALEEVRADFESEGSGE